MCTGCKQIYLKCKWRISNKTLQNNVRFVIMQAISLQISKGMRDFISLNVKYVTPSMQNMQLCKPISQKQKRYLSKRKLQTL